MRRTKKDHVVSRICSYITGIALVASVIFFVVMAVKAVMAGHEGDTAAAFTYVSISVTFLMAALIAVLDLALAWKKREMRKIKTKKGGR